MRQPHHPRMAKRADGRWEIRCPGCAADKVESVPLGIGAPITAEIEARYILENDARTRGRRRVDRTSTPERART